MKGLTTRYSRESKPGAPGCETYHEAYTGERRWRHLRRMAENGSPRKYGRGGMSTDGKSSNIWALVTAHRTYPAAS